MAATLFSPPAWISSGYSTSFAIVLPASLVMPTVVAPRSRASASTALVSVDSPDCEMPTTRTSRRSSGLSYSVRIDGAARETGMRVVISMRYRPNCAALSEVPRATMIISLGRCASKWWRSSKIARKPLSSVFVNAWGCCRVSSSMFHIGSARKDFIQLLAGRAAAIFTNLERFGVLNFRRSITALQRGAGALA